MSVSKAPLHLSSSHCAVIILISSLKFFGEETSSLEPEFNRTVGALWLPREPPLMVVQWKETKQEKCRPERMFNVYMGIATGCDPQRRAMRSSPREALHN